jgi:hypothetical protein
MSTGVMVFSLMRLPHRFPDFDFVLEYPGSLHKGLVTGRAHNAST